MFPHVFQFVRSLRSSFWVIAIGLTAQIGCTLLPSTTSPSSYSSAKSILSPIQAAPDAIMLEVFFIERAADDHLLTTEIWKDIDQIGALPPETRQTIQENGFRIGNVSSNPPPSVQRLLGSGQEIPVDMDENSKPIMGFYRCVAPGLETAIHTGIYRDRCDFLFHEEDREKTAEFEQVGCAFRMTANRLQEGWVRINFQPEIHHGGQQVRRKFNDDGTISLRGGQEIVARTAQRFNVTLNVGEMVLVTSGPGDDPTLGNRFFRHEESGTQKQRVLVVRVVDSGRSLVN